MQNINDNLTIKTIIFFTVISDCSKPYSTPYSPSLGYGSLKPFSIFFLFYIKLDQKSSTDFKLHQKNITKKNYIKKTNTKKSFLTSIFPTETASCFEPKVFKAKVFPESFVLKSLIELDSTFPTSFFLHFEQSMLGRSRLFSE